MPLSNLSEPNIDMMQIVRGSESGVINNSKGSFILIVLNQRTIKDIYLWYKILAKINDTTAEKLL